MSITIKDISKTIENSIIFESFSNNKIENLEFIKFITNDKSTFEKNVLYFTENPSIITALNDDISLNIAIACTGSKNILENKAFNNKNIILFQTDNSLNSFNLLLDLFNNDHKLEKDVSLLLEALSSEKGIQHIVDVSTNILGYPFFIRDLNYKILGHSKDYDDLKDDVWKELLMKGYQTQDDFSYHMKYGLIENSSGSETPTYFKMSKIPDSKLLKNVNTKFLEPPILKDKKTVAGERIWCDINISGEKVASLVVIEAYKPFSEYDVEVIKKISQILSFEIQKDSFYDPKLIERSSLFLKDLLGLKIRTKEVLNEQVKFSKLTFKKYNRIIVFKSKEENTKGIPTNFVKGFYYSNFKLIYSIKYNEYFVGLYTSDDDDNINESQREKLFTFANDTSMPCGISRNFTNLIDASIYFNQAQEAIISGCRIKPEKMLYFYDDYILQHILSVYSDKNSISTLYFPALDDLIAYDKKNKTELFLTLAAYVMKTRNPSNLSNELNIHRNTLYHRLQKIEEIMKIDIENMDTLFNVYISLKIKEFVNDPIF